MSELIYIDTNIWLDYCFGTKGIVPVDEFAKNILDRTLDCEFKIVMSRIVLNELNKKIQTNSLLEPMKIKNKIIFVDFNYSDIQKSKKFKIHFPDCLHIFLAEKNFCKYLITNDKEMLGISSKINIVSSNFFQFQ